MYTYIYIYIYTHVYIYIYIYIAHNAASCGTICKMQFRGQPDTTWHGTTCRELASWYGARYDTVRHDMLVGLELTHAASYGHFSY